MKLQDKGVNSSCALCNSHDEYNLDFFSQEAVTYGVCVMHIRSFLHTYSLKKIYHTYQLILK